MIEENKTCVYQDKCNKIDCDSFCMKRWKTDFYFDQAFIYGDRRNRFPLRIDSDGSDKQAFEQLNEISKTIESFVSKGENLYIYSKNVGNGKTSWALRLCNNYIEKVWFKRDMRPIILFISVPKFLLELKANISEKSEYINHIMKNVLNADLVVWDDIGSKNGTEFEVSHLLSLIDQRLNMDKSNVYTSNLNNEELHLLLGDRLYSRIYNYSTCINFIGKDKRGI